MPRQKPPKLSVVMPVFNAASTLPQALGSILDQTFEDFELIAVDDCSTDSTPEVLAEFAAKDPRIRVIRNPHNLHVAQTLNVGIAAAKGPYIARMDADDWSEPRRLQWQYDFLEAHPDVVICGGDIWACDAELAVTSERVYTQDDATIRESLFRHSPFCHAATVYRTAAVRAAGGYNPVLAGAEDYDLFFRLGQHGSFANIGKLIYKVRFHNASISSRQSRRQEKLTLYIRLKAMIEYGYPASGFDKLYLVLQYASMYVIPQRWKLALFNRLRNQRLKAQDRHH